MNAIVTVDQHQSFGLVPSSMGEAMKLAEMMASAKLVPAALQKSPADCLMVIQQAVRWDMDPFAVAQECSVIQGKLMHSGKLVAAVVNARGGLTQRLSFEYSGEGDNRKITVSGQLQGEPQPRVVEVVLKNAKTQNAMWQKQPDQQLMYHGTRVWARRHTPELMLGVYSPEEFDEANGPAPARRAAPKPAPLKLAAPAVVDHDPETGEVIEPKQVDEDWARGSAQPSAAPSTPPESGAVGDETSRLAEIDAQLTEAAKNGTAALKAKWITLSEADRSLLQAALDRRHKPAAAEVDKRVSH